MVAEAIHHYRARAEAARLLAAGHQPAEIVQRLESRGIPAVLAHDALHEAQRALVHAPVDAALRSALAGGFWFAAGLGVLLLTYGLGRRVGEDIMLAMVLVYGLAVMAAGLWRAFRRGDEHDRSSVFRLFVIAVLLVLAAGGLAVEAYQRQAARSATVAKVTAHLETIRGFNRQEAELARRIELAGESTEQALDALRSLSPDLAAHGAEFSAMERDARADAAAAAPREALLLETFAELAALYAAEAGVYAELREAAALEPPRTAWLRAVPLLRALDRSYGRIDLHSRALEEQLGAVTP